MPTDTKVKTLIINKLTKAQYDVATKDPTQLYLVTGEEDSLPSQEGQAGKFLSTNGTTAFWNEIPSPSITYYDSSNWTLDVTGKILDTETTLSESINVFKNGVLLEPGITNDYITSGSNIIFTIALNNTDKVAVINNNVVAGTYILKPTIVTDGNNAGLAVLANTIYKFTNALSVLNITSAETSDYESVIYFTTGSSITFTDSSGIKWGGGAGVPSLETNTIYCISIRNGLAEIDKFGTTV